MVLNERVCCTKEYFKFEADSGKLGTGLLTICSSEVSIASAVECLLGETEGKESCFGRYTFVYPRDLAEVPSDSL